MDDESMIKMMEDMPEGFSVVSPLPCADCGKMVYLEIEQECTKDVYGRILCLDCEGKAEKLKR